MTNIPDDPDFDPEAENSTSSPTGAPLSFLFGAHDPEHALRAAASYKGAREVHGFFNETQKQKVASNAGVARAAPTKRKSWRTSSAFAESAAPVADTPLPDLTNAYLEKLIGWHREHMGTNPTENGKNVWIKNDDGTFYTSYGETWGTIGQAIRNRSRNVETDAKDLRSHIKEMRVPLTKKILDTYLDWFTEKTGKGLTRQNTVWLKSDDGKSWSVAPFRWHEISLEFHHPAVREALGAHSLELYKIKHRTAKLDENILNQPSPLSALKNG